MPKKILTQWCRVEGCDERRSGRNSLCSRHTHRWQRFGNLNAPTKIRLKYNSDEDRFWAAVMKKDNPDECWEWQQSKDKRGYGRFYYHGKHILAHRASWFFTYQQMPEKWLLHACDNPSCVNPTHLSEGDHTENMRQMSERKRSLFGTKALNAKLNDAMVRAIRELRTKGLSQSQRAMLFGVSPSAIQGVDDGRTWRHVT